MTISKIQYSRMSKMSLKKACALVSLLLIMHKFLMDYKDVDGSNTDPISGGNEMGFDENCVSANILVIRN